MDANGQIELEVAELISMQSDVYKARPGLSPRDTEMNSQAAHDKKDTIVSLGRMWMNAPDIALVDLRVCNCSGSSRTFRRSLLLELKVYSLA
jgi:hypothetical protein